MTDWEFLAGKGGFSETSPLPPLDERGNRDPEALARWRAGTYLDRSILVKCRTGQQIVIDPEGYNWAHNVGLNVRPEKGEPSNVIPLVRVAKDTAPQAAILAEADMTPSPLEVAYRNWIDGLIAAGNFKEIRSFEDWQQPYTRSAYEAWVIDLHQRQVYGKFKSYPEWFSERLQSA